MGRKRKDTCKNGHLMTNDNRSSYNGECLACARQRSLDRAVILRANKRLRQAIPEELQRQQLKQSAESFLKKTNGH